MSTLSNQNTHCDKDDPASFCASVLSQMLPPPPPEPPLITSSTASTLLAGELTAEPCANDGLKNFEISNNTLINKKVMCEVCGLREAKVNLNLEFGSHRECRICWND